MLDSRLGTKDTASILEEMAVLKNLTHLIYINFLNYFKQKCTSILQMGDINCREANSNIYLFIYSFKQFLKSLFIYFEREIKRASRGGAERERKRESQAGSAKPDAELKFTNCEIMT